MSSQQFIETLKLIGYPKADSLNARALDWMFEDETALPFLSWFCNTVGHQNVLSVEEKTAFQELEKSGEGSLDGAALDEALACVLSSHDESLSLEALREDVERLKEDAERHRKRKQKLVQARNKLSLHHTGLTHRLSKLTDLELGAKQDYKSALQDLLRANDEDLASLERAVHSVKELLFLYQDSCPPGSAATEQRYTSVFLSQLNLDPFHQMEEKYTRVLTAYTKKQFFQGIADMAGGELSRYELLEVSDPMRLLVKGQTQGEFLQDCEELARLQAVFPKSESDRVSALVEKMCAASVLKEANNILQTIHYGTFPQDTDDIRSDLDMVNKSLLTVKAQLKKLTDTEVPDLIKELAALHGTTVLTGDYRLKVVRQDYFTTNQDQVIKYLVDQRARNEFLTMAYEVEAQNHKDAHHLMTALQQFLHTRLSSFRDRMVMPVDPKSAERQLFLSYSQMTSAAETLKQRHTAAKAEAVSTADKYQHKIRQMEQEVRRCQEVLYAESSTVGGQPMLTPRAVQEAMTELDNMLQKLEAAILDTITDINTKKKGLKKDVLQTKERELFTYFHLHPDRLRKTVDNLEQRLQAQSVS
ncbi:hypothetical protein BaRGS_00006606 [Batillaria attramentaria]|uniref:HAUS augmin-like complex subunit 3 N-terminal domain-containing protein n=1 Tax=Batillaria attramentaria TaxID=370345 RepID=A0ABD0LTH9_9CAEN